MTRKRGADFDLWAALGDPGFTPRARDASGVLDVYADGGPLADPAERALVTLGAVARAAVIERVERGTASPRVLRLLGRLPPAPEATRVLVATLSNEDARTRRAAALALGRLGSEDASRDLSDALDREPDPSARRAMVEALGRLGGDVARAAIDDDARRSGPSREAARARVMLDRTDVRAVESSIDLSVPPGAPVAIALRCRAGLEGFLTDELDASLRATVENGGALGSRVDATLGLAPEVLLSARTWLSFGFPLPPCSTGGDLAESIVTAITSPAAMAIMRRWTQGPLRFRLSFAAGGKRRAVVWRVAEEAHRRVPELVNDPVASPWEARVQERRGAVQIELVPHFSDPRFAYRRGDVPAASHPTIAAALVRASGPRPDDVVWDPFAGSGTELCERALAGPFASLIGSDLDGEALVVARANLEASGARAFTLLEGDAASVIPEGPPPTRIITNPPLGRRVQRSASLAPLLDRFLHHAARTLAAGGRIAWISPFAERTRTTASLAGLTVLRATDVDLGGFAGEIQVFEKRRR